MNGPALDKCSYCGRALQAGEYVTRCSSCGAAHDEQCWMENGRCTTFGCAGTPTKVIRYSDPESLSVAEAHSQASATVVGKTCPVCQHPIKTGADAIQCPQCGIPHRICSWRLSACQL